MNKQIPAASKIIQFQNFKRSVQLHENKIRNAKPTLTTRVVMKESQSSINLNRTPKQPYGNSFSRMIDIEIQNKALLKKLTQKSIPKIPHPINNNNPLPPWQQPSITKLPPNNRKKYYEQHERRLQNEGLLKRIKETKPMYQMRKYMSERRVTQKYINSISKFGYKDYKPNKTLVKFDASTLRDDSMDKLGFSRRKKNWLAKIDIQSDDKENNVNKNATNEQNDEYEIKYQEFYKNEKTSQIPKYREFTQRTINKNKKTKTEKKVQATVMENYLQQSPIAQMRRSYLSSSNLSNLSQSFYHFIPEQEIKLNGKTFLLKGRQSMTKLKLELLEVSKNKPLGNQFIHQVEIPINVYTKKFEGRIDVLIERLRFDQKIQGFYLL